MEKLKIIGWISFDSDCENILIDSQDTLTNIMDEVCEEIRKNNYCFAGDEHQTSLSGVPLFNNGKCLRCSMRVWGGIMSKVYDESPNYTNYYCKETMSKESILPVYKEGLESYFKKDQDCLPVYSNLDIDMILDSISLDMPFITTDKVLNILLPILEKEYKEKNNG